MIRCHLTCSAIGTGAAAASDLEPLALLRESMNDTIVQLVDDSAGADLVVFAESHQNGASAGDRLEGVRNSSVFRARPDRCVVHSGADTPWPAVPGFYPSIERRWYRPGWMRSSCYLIRKNPFLEPECLGWQGSPTLLASFTGACRGKPVRQQMLDLSHPRCMIKDTFSEFVGAIRRGDAMREAELKRSHVRGMLASRFVLCPRGAGTSSIRLFEAMECGRAPVIISDDWVEPEGPEWEHFAVRVPEGRIREIPKLLESLEGEADARGRLAREAWEEWFSPTRLLERIAQQGLDMIACAQKHRASRTVYTALQTVRPVHVRRTLRALRQGIRQSLARETPSPTLEHR